MKKETRSWEPIAPATARFMALEQMAQAMSSRKATSSTSYGARRANLGERFLTVALQVQNQGGKHCGGGATNYGVAYVRLNVDGLLDAPVAGLTQAIAAMRRCTA